MTVSGTAYNWSDTESIATTACPHNDKSSINKSYSVEGEWSSFNETVCGAALGQLIILNDTFNNVCKILNSTNSLIQ